MTRILLVDDHPLIRQGIRQILASAFHDVCIEEAGTADTGISAVRNAPWDVLLLDIALPDLSGLEVLKTIRAERPLLPVLMLSMYAPDQFARRALKAGASGYLSKDSTPDVLVTGVQALLAGRRYLATPNMEHFMSDQRSATGRALHESLSDREYQVVRMMASGFTVSQVATRLSLSVKTVSTYRTRILQKMEMSTTAELMRYGIEHQLQERSLLSQ
jgi:two-component system, NarL family, invasion response regulator UvrY